MGRRTVEVQSTALCCKHSHPFRTPVPLVMAVIDPCHFLEDPDGRMFSVTTVDKQLILRAPTPAMRDEWVRQLRCIKAFEIKSHLGHVKRPKDDAAVHKVRPTQHACAATLQSVCTGMSRWAGCHDWGAWLFTSQRREGPSGLLLLSLHFSASIAKACL